MTITEGNKLLNKCSCGGEAEIISDRGEDSVTTYVRCKKCNRQEEIYEDIWSVQVEYAVEEWNNNLSQNSA